MATSGPAVTPLSATVSNPERVFPTLTSEQVTRLATHGRRRPTTRGEVLVEVGDRSGNVKRVASAVGEGSIAIAFVHQVLRQ